MGIKSLTKTIQKESPESIHHENIYKLSGKRLAVDASLIIYQQLLNNSKGKLFRTSQGKITNHITGLFYKIMNYISLNITLIFVFDGKPPDNKKECIKGRKEKSEKAKELCVKATTEEDKNKYEKASIRVTKGMIDDVKQLLRLMGVSYIHPNGEGEAYASELCRIGYVDYVLSEDMDSLVYGCPRLIRKCVDRSLKRKDIVSIFHYQQMIQDIELTEDQFTEFCILCGCDYCQSPPKIGPITALKLMKQYKSIDKIIELPKYSFPENYKETFEGAKKNFKTFYNQIDIQSIPIHSSEVNTQELSNHLIHTIEMNPKRVQTTMKKFHNVYQSK
jgi:flap endonuclease-1